MARYIKANPKVAKFLQLENDRNTVKDGNYLLWQADMLSFGPLTHLSETLAMIGGIALMPHEAREEQDGTVIRPLPIATDPRFVVETAAPANEPEPEPGNGESEAQGETPNGESATEPEPEPGNGESEAQGETPNGESEEITAGEVGNVEDIVDFGPEPEPDNGGE